MSELIITNIITAISTLGASSIGAYFMYKSNSDKKEYKKLIRNLYKYLKEIKSFYELEQKYIEEIELLNKKPQVTIKKDIRAKLDLKPNMTTNDVNIVLKANRYLGINDD